MKKSLKLFTVSLTVLAVIVLFWQFSPTMNAQKSSAKKTVKPVVQSLPSEAADDSSIIYLNAGQINAASAEAQSLRQSVGGFSGKKMHLVKFDGAIQPDWYKSLTDSGLEIVDYIPNYTYLVYGDAISLQKLQSNAKNLKSHIQWEGAYLDEYRISPNVYQQQSKEQKKNSLKSDLSSDLFVVQLYRDADTNEETLKYINSLQTKPVEYVRDVLHYVNVKVGLNEEGLKQIASRPDVISIQPYLEPKKLDEVQDLILTGNLTGGIPPNGQNYLTYLAGKGFTQAQFDASGFAVNLSDSPIDNGTQSPFHFGLYKLGTPAQGSRIIYNRLEGTANTGSTLQAKDGHGNINSHIIGGYVPDSLTAFPHRDANNYRYGLGVAPFVKIGSSVIFDPNTFTSPDYENLESEAYRDGARISSNSWGSDLNSYTADSQAYDALVRDAQPAGATVTTAGNQDYIIVFAAGNGGSGANTVGEPGTAKNVITVGASENVRAFGGADNCAVADTGADNANDIIGFSSRGPTSDGRKKPDIMGPGTHVSGGAPQSALASPAGSGTGSALAIFDGSGVCGGVGTNFFPSTGQQYYTASSGTSHSTPAIAGVAALIRQHFINQSLTPPTPALTKALLSASSRYLTGTGANDNLFSNNQGMGEMSLNNYFDLMAAPRILKDQAAADRFTASGQQRVVTGTISDTTKPFRVALAWTDAPGATTGNAFVNNLDLEVTVGGQTYKGNVFSGANSVTGGTADTKDNTESVFLPAGVSGNFVVKIKATNIAGDGVPNTNTDALDQDYSLVVTNAAEAAIPVVTTNGLTVTAESCSPANGAIDPDETVTINLALGNVGTSNTTNLVATLQATGGVNSPSGAQNYGAIVANGATVSRPFTFTAAALCGQNITLTLQLQDGATNLGTVTQTVRVGGLGAASTVTSSTGNLTTAIPDVSSVDIPINVTQTGSIADVNVKFRANHTFDGDVVVDLISPDGTTVNLVTNRGSSGANYGSGTNDCSGTPTIFDDAAATAITAGTAPFAGSYKPESLLSAFNGKSLAGTWKLRVSDTAADDTGTVGCVQLEVSRQPFLCCGVSGTPAIASGGGAVLTAESITPHNSVPDPNETVTVNLPVLNTGDGSTTNLVGTLQATGGVLSPSAPQSYGAIAPGAAVISRPFTFVANGACGSNITLTLALTDGATSYGTITYTMRLGTVSTASQTFSNTTSVTIPATGTGASTGAPATPYPSSITVSGFTQTVTKVAVTLKGLNHTFPDDVDMLLVGPTGQKFIILSDVGGTNDWVNDTLTLDDSATSPLSDTGANPTGTYKPTNIGTGDAFPAPAPAAPYLTPASAGTDTFASAFGGLNPNGVWSLYIVDDVAGDTGTMTGGWDLTITSTSNVCQTQACSLTAPANVVKYDYDFTTAPGEIVTYPSAGITGACGVVTYNPPSGSFFPAGTTTVTVNSANLANTESSTNAASAATSFNVSVIPPTAASATVSGIVQNSAGRAVAGATVSLTDTQGNVSTVRTNPFGYFKFINVHTGGTYIANVSAKSYKFAPSVLTVNQDAADLRFVAIP